MTFPKTKKNPPHCKYIPGLPHVNVYPNGRICGFHVERCFRTGDTALEIIFNTYYHLIHPNVQDPTQRQSYQLCKNNPNAYEKELRAYAKTLEEHKASWSYIDKPTDIIINLALATPLTEEEVRKVKKKAERCRQSNARRIHDERTKSPDATIFLKQVY